MTGEAVAVVPADRQDRSLDLSESLWFETDAIFIGFAAGTSSLP